MAAQLIATNGPSFLGLSWWTARTAGPVLSRCLATKEDYDPPPILELARARAAAWAHHVRETAEAPIETPPFYALECVPSTPTTTGGGKRNARAQVLDHTGRPIPRLYEAGELGSIFSNLFQRGGFLTECMVFGRIAARNALAEPAWSVEAEAVGA